MISTPRERRPPELSIIFSYLAVGFFGFCLNMLVLTGALFIKVPIKGALILGIASSTLFNFAMDRHVVFPSARTKTFTLQFFKFIGVCLIGAGINYAIALGMLAFYPELMPQAAEWVGIIIATTVNYLLLRFFVFI